jgi:hypothetical protein
MLLRSSSTPFLHHPFLSSSSSPSSLQLRRAFSDSHILASAPSTAATPSCASCKPASGGLHTELSFSVYNTFGEHGGAAPLASQEEPRHDEPDVLLLLQDQQQRTAQPDHPEVPLFLARGLGIDRIASGFFTAGTDKTNQQPQGAGAKMEGVQEQVAPWDEEAAALDAQYKRMVDEQPGNALFLRNYAQFLHEVGRIQQQTRCSRVGSSFIFLFLHTLLRQHDRTTN